MGIPSDVHPIPGSAHYHSLVIWWTAESCPGSIKLLAKGKVRVTNRDDVERGSLTFISATAPEQKTVPDPVQSPPPFTHAIRRAPPPPPIEQKGLLSAKRFL